MLGKLDGITQLLPDVDFFLFMYVRKEAALSSEIEGTQANMVDALRVDFAEPSTIPQDVENIIHYIRALNKGLSDAGQQPLSARFIKGIHRILLDGTKDGIGKTPGEFRTTQNWVDGATIETATYVPPPAHHVGDAMSDIVKYLHVEDGLDPLIRIGLIHAQFETVHPFLEGNGRTGRLLIPVYLCVNKLLEQPVLYLSVYLKKYRQEYFSHLADYHDKGYIDPWIRFFLQGICETAESAIDTAKKINVIREASQKKVEEFAPKRLPTALALLRSLYQQPIVTAASVQVVTGLKSRSSTNELITEFVKAGILKQSDEAAVYGREFVFSDYLDLFTT